LFSDLFIGMFTSMSTLEVSKPRLLRAVNPALGSYFRVDRDYKPLQALLAEDRAGFTGLVFDAWDHQHQGELRRVAAGRVESVLDTKTFELSTVRGPEDQRLAKLPWAGDQLPHTPVLLRGPWGDRLAELIAEEVATRQYSEVTDISRRPQPVRPSLYLEEFLRPATDFALRAAKVEPKLERTRQRLESWRLPLGAMNTAGPPTTVALAPEGKRTQPHLRKSA